MSATLMGFANLKDNRFRYALTSRQETIFLKNSLSKFKCADGWKLSTTEKLRRSPTKLVELAAHGNGFAE